jgi:hypothetical protein
MHLTCVSYDAPPKILNPIEDLAMAIENELSSEIATALLTGKTKTKRELHELKEIVIKVHSTLRQLEAAARRRRLIDRSVDKPEPTGQSPVVKSVD